MYWKRESCNNNKLNLKDTIVNIEGKNQIKLCKNNGMFILNCDFKEDEEGNYKLYKV